jgi:hypothetical protein
MNSKLILISVVLASILFLSIGVSAKDFDVTDISYSYVGGYPVYGGYAYGGYINPYTGMIDYPYTYTYVPTYTTYYPTYYSGYDYYYGPRYYDYGYYGYNTISYSDATSSLSFSWVR